MLSARLTDLLSIEFRGLFKDHEHCLVQLAAKRDSGDADTPPELTERPIFDLSPDLFIWVTQKHLENDSGHLVARDVMSNVSLAGLSGSYGQIVDMLADAGHEQRAAQIWRAEVASHMEVFRQFLRARKAVTRFDGLSQAKQNRSAPDRFERSMARDYPAKRQLALEAAEAFGHWSSRYGIAERHKDQIALWKAELETEAKPKLPPADKTPMSDDLFWQIIADARSGSDGETILNIEERMTQLSPKAIRDAARLAQDRLQAAYRDDVWALAYLLQDGCSDDAFDDFRNWMILQGQDTYNSIVSDPDRFDPDRIETADFGGAGSLFSAFENAYLSRSGKPLILPVPKTPTRALDEDSFRDLLPTLAARLSPV